MTKIQAQMLYNLRELTGFISGNDLHELFIDLVGEPSPSGYMEFELEDLEKSELGKLVLLELKRPLLNGCLPEIAWNILGEPHKGFPMGMDKAIKHYQNVQARFILYRIRADEDVPFMTFKMCDELFTHETMLAAMPILSKNLGYTPDFKWL